MSYFSGKRGFITGGSAGIGRETAIRLASLGAHVVVCARGQEKLDETVEAMRSAGSDSQTFGALSADVTSAERMNTVAEQAVELLGGVDVLIANTGFAQCRPVSEADDAHFRQLMDVNFFGHVNTVRAFLPTFEAQKSGDIVLVSSMLAVLSVWGYSAYSASKFAIRGFAEALRQEMLLHNVTVKLFLPPTTDTPGLAKENEDKPPLTREMEENSSFNATHPTEKVVDKMLAWIEKGKFVGYATFDSWFQYFATRYFPNLTLKLADQELRSAIKRLEKKGLG